MTVLVPESTKDAAKVLDELFSSARYLVDAQGSRTDVVLSLLAWEKLLAWLEDVDDRIIIQEWLPRLQAGPASSGALRWEDVSDEWDDEEAAV